MRRIEKLATLDSLLTSKLARKIACAPAKSESAKNTDGFRPPSFKRLLWELSSQNTRVKLSCPEVSNHSLTLLQRKTLNSNLIRMTTRALKGGLPKNVERDLLYPTAMEASKIRRTKATVLR